MVARMDPTPIETAIAGGLLGVAVGDALGTTVEFMAPEEIRRRFGVHREIVGGGPFGGRPGQGTDDTDLTWAVVAGYLEAEGGNSLECLNAIARAFLEWFDTTPQSIGRTTFCALSELRAGGDPAACGLTAESSCGNGSLMRALPTALIRADPERRRRESELISAVTHAHRRCIDSCVAYNEIAAALIDGAAPAEAVAAAAALDLDPAVGAALKTPADRPVTELSAGGYVIDSLACAVWAVQQPGTLESVLVDLVNRGDDADTVGAIAGGLLGIVWGPAGIPTRWRDRLEYADRFMGAAAEIARIRGAR